ncbi:MAG: hypothetical protein JSR70_07540 [Proteobacteria bacterium]|nr:hypothetical protein [Pseudomonadota bacterium]
MIEDDDLHSDADDVAQAASSYQAPQPPASLFDRVVAALEAWYDKHFHRSVVEGTPAISADDKESLFEAVKSAAQPKE